MCLYFKVRSEIHKQLSDEAILMALLGKPVVCFGEM